MYEPSKRLGAEDGEPKKKPALAIAIGFDPKKRLGDEGGDEAPAKETTDSDAQMDQACVGICKALNVSASAAPRLRNYLEAFFHAADSAPHDEGEHTNETESDSEET